VVTVVDTVVTLISYTKAQDAKGVIRDGVPIRRERLAQVESIGRSEFYAAGKQGLRPALKFTLFHANYNGERELEHMGQRYAVYRTYRVPGTDYMELWTEQKGGVSNGN
jgi:hypothetical protein